MWGTEACSSKEKEGGGRKTKEKRRANDKKTAKDLHMVLEGRIKIEEDPPRGKDWSGIKKGRNGKEREGGGEPQRGTKVTEGSKQSSGRKTAVEGSDQGTDRVSVHIRY